MKSFSPARKVLLGLAILILVSVGSLAAAVAYLRSESGSARIVALARDFLETKMNTKLTYSEGRFDPFAGAHFKNLSVVKSDEQTQLTFTAKSLDLDYRIAFLARRLDVERMHLAGAEIKLRAKTPAAGATPAPSPTPAEGRGLASLGDLVKNPPVKIAIRGVKIEKLKVDALLEDPGKSMHAVFEDFDFEFALEWVKSRLETSGKIEFSPKSKVALRSKPLSASLGLTTAAAWALEIRHEGGEWRYELRPSAFSAFIADLKAHQSSPEGAETRLALPTAEARGRFALDARTKDFLVPMPDTFQKIETETSGRLRSLKIEQKPARGPGQRVAIDEQSFDLKAGLAGTIEATALAKIQGLFVAPEKGKGPLAKPVSVDADFAAKLPRDLSKADLKGKLALASIPLARFEAVVSGFAQPQPGAPRPAAIAAIGRAEISAEPRLADVAPAAKALRVLGAVGIVADFDTKAETAQGRVLARLDAKIRNARYGEWEVKTDSEAVSLNGDMSTKGRTELANLKAPAPGVLPAVLEKPIVVTHKAAMSEKRGLDAEITAQVPAIEVPSTARVEATHVAAKLSSPDPAKAKDLDFKFSLKQGKISLDKKVSPIALPLSGLEAEARGTVRGGTVLAIDEFKANIGDSLMKATGSVSANASTKDAQVRADLSLKVPSDFPPVAGQIVRGEITMPVTVSVLQGKEINLAGEAKLVNLGWSKDDLSVTGISGSVPLSEKLLWDGKNIRFTHLISRNPFERVDFERVRPLTERNDRLRIDKIRWDDRVHGPFIGFFSIEQNMIVAHRFDMDLGTTGRVYGEMFFDAYPSNLQFGILSRVTTVNLSEVLPAKFLKRHRVPTGENNVSARTGIVLDLSRSTLDGRVDVTEIGGPQLVSLINVLDPLYEDEKLNKARSLLAVGYPTGVELAFAKGYLDMDIDLSALGLKQRQSLRGLPLASFLTKASAEVRKQTEKGPLK